MVCATETDDRSTIHTVFMWKLLEEIDIYLTAKSVHREKGPGKVLLLEAVNF